jgi:hypothetical protein
MPLELGVWRIDNEVKPVEFNPLDMESRLEGILEENIEIASPNWHIIGRQVRTDYGKYIDLLAIDRDTNLVVLELKKDKTARDIVAQLLDYGSWIKELTDDRIAKIFDEYQKNSKNNTERMSLDDSFRKKFGISMSDEINSNHELVVVASSLDPSTERIVRYLADEYAVQINAIFFRVFQDEGREYLSRAWFRDPADMDAGIADNSSQNEWNEEYYVSFGYDKNVIRDGFKWGYIVAGGGPWYSRTLSMLEPGARIWVNVPGAGYIGVGIVEESMRPVDEFLVKDESNNPFPLVQVSDVANSLDFATDSRENADYLVRIKWLKTIDPDDAIHEKGFFGNQNSAARPRSPKWVHTVERLKSRFSIK